MSGRHRSLRSVLPGLRRRIIVGWVLLLYASGFVPAGAADPRVAVAPFDAGDVNPGTVEFLTDFLQQELSANGSFQVLPPDQVAAKAGTARCFSEKCGLELADALRVDRVLLGRARKKGGEYLLELSVVDRPEARKSLSVSASAATEDGLFVRAGDLLEQVTRALAAPLAVVKAPANEAPAKSTGGEGKPPAQSGAGSPSNPSPARTGTEPERSPATSEAPSPGSSPPASAVRLPADGGARTEAPGSGRRWWLIGGAAAVVGVVALVAGGGGGGGDGGSGDGPAQLPEPPGHP
ncbi:MAG: hypothetical protein KC729_14575 [Candidatus Eisenbacteria bacterium]|uniref:DUF2380 domain-containing protein n=1 Tax=Eiseniibacteriota bacterium TaxID=2212470 RepID=A0A956M164_UNCEI|nr:hypothetical protein [Candidatus Eisenbacteria bacterium]